MSKLSLTEATVLALQGKLPIKENKLLHKTKQLKKEDIDINVDEKTNVSVMDNSTVVDTENATIIVDKKDTTDLDNDSVEIPVDSDETIIPEDLPETNDLIDDEPVSDDLPDNSNLPQDTTDIDLPIENNEIEESKQKKFEHKKLQEEVSNEAYEIAEAIANEFKGKETVTWDEFNTSLEKYMKELNLPDNYFNEDLSDFESDVRGILSQNYGFATIFEGENEGGLTTKFESIEIEISDDGKEVEVTTDNGEEVEVEDETPEDNEEGNEETSDDENSEIVNSDDENSELDIENISDDDMIDESKKLQEDIEAAPFRGMVLQSIYDDIDSAETVAERLALAMSDDDCKWYCETYELVEPLDDATNNKYYKDIWGNLRDITGQIVDDDGNLEEAKHRKIESIKKIEKRILNNKKVENNTRTFHNANKTVNRNTLTKCDQTSFKEALSKVISKVDKKVESVELNKVVQLNDTIKMEATLKMINNTQKNICLEMKQNKTNNKFTKYNLIKENKNNNLNLTMLTYKNKDNILECRYINKI